MAWNKPSTENQQQKKPNAKVPSKVKGIVAGLVTVCALGGLCLWMFSGGEATSSSLQKKERGLIKEITPATTPTNALPLKLVNPREAYDHEKLFRDKQGILRYKNGGARAYDPTRPVDKAPLRKSNYKSIFKHRSEREIEALITIPAGEPRFVTRRYDVRFEQDFLKSMEEPIIVTKEDSPRDAELKRMMNEAKIEIAARMRAGEKLADILTSTQQEIQRLATYKHQLRQEVLKLSRAEGVSDADIGDYIKAVNMMLEKNGIAPVKESSLLKFNIKFNSKKGKKK